MIKFTTESGSKYIIEDGLMYRFNELPVYNYNGDTEMIAGDLIDQIIQLEIGHSAIIMTNRGPLRTTPVTHIERTEGS
jgi:hypothetical protein